MGLTYSKWENTVEDSCKIGKESFEALFDKRDPGKAKKRLKQFLDAYVKSVKETRKKDRFPCLADIDKKLGAKGKVYE